MRKLFSIFMAFLLIGMLYIPSYATETTDMDQSGTTDTEQPETTEHPETTEYPDDPAREPDLVCNASIVMDAATGQVIYEKNAHEKKYPASITKIMTSLVALEHGINFNDTITMSENAIWGIDRLSTHIGLDVGEQISVEDCMYAILLQSANECAYAMAEYVAGDVESFAELMNKKAEELGCENTHFVTPNGLHDANHYTCAYDMALITKAAIQDDTFRKITGTLSYTIPETNLSEDVRTLWQGNKMINPAETYYYEYCEGGKTGYTTDANNTLVTFAKKDDLELICVILDCDGWVYSYTDSKALYNYCFNNYTHFYPLSDFSFQSEDDMDAETNIILNNYYSGLDHDMIDLNIDRNFTLLINKSIDTAKIERRITLYNEAKDNVLGEIVFTYEGEQLGSTLITTTTPLLSSKVTQEEGKKGDPIWKNIGKILVRIFVIILSLFALLIIYMIFAAIVRSVRRERKRRSYNRKRRKRDDDYYF